MAKLGVRVRVVLSLVLLGSMTSSAWGWKGWTCVKGSEGCSIDYDWNPGMSNSFQVKFRADASVHPAHYRFILYYTPLANSMGRHAYEWNVFISPGVTGPLSPPITGTAISGVSR